MGYMMLQFLTTSAPTTPVTPVTPVTPTSGQAVVQQPSNSYVNLRSSQNSQISNVIAQVPSGTVVTVLSNDGTYCKINYKVKY